MRSWINASLRCARGRQETLLALASYGGSSAYWLALAFVLPATSYGKMMTLQASVLLVATLLTFRMFDLFFYLVGQRGYDPQASFRTTLACELASVALVTIVCGVGAFLLGTLEPDLPPAWAIAALGFVSAGATAQGASIGRLRYEKRTHLIAWADLTTLACWGAAAASLLILADRPVALLVIGTIPAAVRSLILGLLARASASVLTGARFVRTDTGAIARFLASGQVVAMYRLARSTLGAANAAINITYQQGYAAFVHARSGAERLAVRSKMRREGLWITLGLYPVSALFSLAYALNKPDVDVVALQLVTLGVTLAFVPAVLQQPALALLLIDGSNRAVNTAFLFGLAVLAVLASALFIVPSIWLFLLATIGAGVARQRYLSLRADPLYQAHSGAAEQTHSPQS